MTSPKIFVTRRWPQTVERLLEAEFNVTSNTKDKPLNQLELQKALQTYDILLTTVTDNFSSETLSCSHVKTKLLCNYGVGYSHICAASAKRLNITVTNTPDVLSECTADLAMMMLMMSARRASEGEHELRGGNWAGWRPTHLLGTKVSGKTLGIVGFGRIGQHMAHRAHFGFGMNVIVHNRSSVSQDTLDTFKAIQAPTLDALLEQSDFISLHLPGGASNTHLINAGSFKKMKNHAFLINTARGEIVDENALASALHSQHIAGAALDVYRDEPRVSAKLLNAPNLTLLPHLGSATLQTRADMGKRAIVNLKSFIKGQTPPDQVI